MDRSDGHSPRARGVRWGRGFFRLWLLVAGIWVIAASIVLYRGYDSIVSETHHYVYSPSQGEFVLTENQTAFKARRNELLGFNPDALGERMSSIQSYGYRRFTDYEDVGSGVWIYFRPALEQEKALRLGRAIAGERQRAVLLEHLGLGVALILGPPVAVLLLAVVATLILRWILRGFRPT